MADLAERQALFALNVAKLIQHIFESGYKCTLGEAFRTREQAQIYVDKGIGILNSLHCSRLAIDLNLFSPDGTYLTDSKDYIPFGKYWESLNPENRAGCFFSKPDGNHFETKKTSLSKLSFNGSIK